MANMNFVRLGMQSLIFVSSITFVELQINELLRFFSVAIETLLTIAMM